MENKEECSFLKKRTKKLLRLEARAAGRSATASKRFLLLFFKKDVLPCLLLAGCATSADPAQGGFISGVNGLVSGGYDQRVQQRQADLQRMQQDQAAAEEQERQDRAALQDKSAQVAALRAQVEALDASMRRLQAAAARRRAQNRALSEHDRDLLATLSADRARLAVLHARMQPGMAPSDYAATKQEYDGLQRAMTALSEQLQGLSKS